MPLYGRGYDNLNDAAAAAMLALGRQPNVGAQEYATGFVRDPQSGQIYRTQFSQGSAGSAPVGPILREILGAGANPLALAHNHPGTNPVFDPRYLSRQDTALGQGNIAFKDGTQIPPMDMFLLANTSQGVQDQRKGTGEMSSQLTRPEPGSQQRVRKQLERTDPFLAKFPIDELMQHIAQRNPLVASYLTERGDFPIPGIGIPGLAASRPLELKRRNPRKQMPEPERGDTPRRVSQ